MDMAVWPVYSKTLWQSLPIWRNVEGKIIPFKTGKPGSIVGPNEMIPNCPSNKSLLELFPTPASKTKNKKRIASKDGQDGEEKM